jgi:hypothetical protein
MKNVQTAVGRWSPSPSGIAKYSSFKAGLERRRADGVLSDKRMAIDMTASDHCRNEKILPSLILGRTHSPNGEIRLKVSEKRVSVLAMVQPFRGSVWLLYPSTSGGTPLVCRADYHP